ncbi:unnamed protein product [Hymenolepis diminuta]|uniref:Dynein light chain n=1 Tax=Hymenolepis diminuta TaxID=6216 RepID=A0A564ZCX9_HYMDI|nr:unnamed protein product [Hymenolepis diminuta]
MFRYSRSQQQEQTFSPEERLEVLSTKMSRNMEQDALDVASRALQRSREPREIAQYIKKEFDEKYEPNWHCIVGNHFGRISIPFPVESLLIKKFAHNPFFFVWFFTSSLWMAGKNTDSHRQTCSALNSQ